MSEARKENRSAVILVLAGIVLAPLLLLAAYVVGFFYLSEESTDLSRPYRIFPSKAVAEFYRPAVRIESYLTGRPDGYGWRSSQPNL